MASRWRIRHKLMLGLGLVVATMVLLLGGTIFGVWSYHLDMKSLREWSAQLRQAEEFKAAVSDIKPLIDKQVAPKNDWPMLAPCPPHKEGDPPDQEMQAPLLPEEKSIDPKEKPPQTPEEAIELASKKLADYEAKLIDPSNHELPPSTNAPGGSLDLIRILHADLDKLNQQLNSRLFRRAEMPPLRVQMAPNVDDQKIDTQQWRQWLDLLAKIARDARDLRDNIGQDIHTRIDGSRKKYQTTVWIASLASVVFLLLVWGLLGSFYSWVFHPIRDLEAGVNRVARGDLAHRIEVHSGDEMEDLGAAFNDMMQRLQDLYSDLARQVNERSRQLVRSERLASVGFLAAGVAHEINNPLASIAFCSEALEARLNAASPNGQSDEEHELFSKYLKMIQEEAFRCKNITERLLAFSRPGERRRDKTDLRELVQLVLDVTQHLPNHRGKEIQFEMNAERLSVGGVIAAWVNSEEIKSVVLNLVVNALDSMDEGGKLTIRLGQRDDMAELRFSDNGCGMTQEVLENIFEPFYTRSRTGKGTGLGLTISHRIITQHGGEIEASSPGPNRGSTFIVRLPMNVPEAPPVLPGPGLTDDKSAERAAPARAA